MDESPLAKLPPELRNRIYELALRQENPVRLHWTIWPEEKVHHMDATRSTPTILALTKTCRQIRQESNKLFYAVNRFIVDCRRMELCSTLMDVLVQQLGKDNVVLAESIVLDTYPTHSHMLPRFFRWCDELNQWLKGVGPMPLKLRTIFLSCCVDDTLVIEPSDIEASYRAMAEKADEKLATLTWGTGWRSNMRRQRVIEDISFIRAARVAAGSVVEEA